MDKKLEQLKKIIIKSVPSIMELKFGCEVGYNDSVYKMRGNGKVLGGETHYELDNGFFGLTYALISDCKILGRPIILEDMLRVIDKGILVDRQGIFYDIKTIKPLNIGRAYLIGKTLDNQSPETIDFLLDLLK